MSNTLNPHELYYPSSTKLEFKPQTSAYAVCIPVMNEGSHFQQQIQLMTELGIQEVADIIILDGNSSDGSTSPDFLRDKVRTVLINNSNDTGLGADYRMGLAYAMQEGYRGVITIDGHGKDDPSSIPDFIRELEDGWDFIQGSRFIKHGNAVNTPQSRKFAIRYIHSPLISLGAGFTFTDSTNGYRGLSPKLILHPDVNIFRNIFVGYELLAYISVAAARAGLRVKEIPVTRRYPPDGTVPTKIVGVKAKLDVLLGVLKVIFGYYSPN